MLAPKLDEFLVVAVLGSAVVDHFHVCNQTAKNTMRTGSCSCSPKTFQHPRLFTHPSHPWGESRVPKAVQRLWQSMLCQRSCVHASTSSHLQLEQFVIVPRFIVKKKGASVCMHCEVETCLYCS